MDIVGGWLENFYIEGFGGDRLFVGKLWVGACPEAVFT